MRARPISIRIVALGALGAVTLIAACTSPRRVERSERASEPTTTAETLEAEGPKRVVTGIAPKEFPRIPEPDAGAAWVPEGFKTEVFVKDLTYPTSIEFGDSGEIFVAEAGYAYGDLVAPARIFRIAPEGELTVLADQFNGPVTDLLWHEGQLYVSHRGKISRVAKDGTVEDLVTGLPSFGDHHNNQMAVGPDGKIYFGQGTVTNSGVVGLDNVYPFLWLTMMPDVCDVPAHDMDLEGETFTTPDPLTVLSRSGDLVHLTKSVKQILSPSEPLLVKTGAFQPFGKSSSHVKGSVKASGTILRMNPDGSDLEVFAWGLRNPYGVKFGPDGKLYVTDDGYDERGSRPIANAPDCVWRVEKDRWYGWPDYAGGEPVTDAKFKSPRGDAPTFLMKTHPPVEKPVAVFPHHAAVTKLDFDPKGVFGHKGQMFVAAFGTGAPVNGTDLALNGFNVVAIDLESHDVKPFFTVKESALGPKGYEHSATKGPRRPVAVRFSPDGESLYVVDFGAMAAFPAAAGPIVRPFSGSGVIWRVTKADAKATMPTKLSPQPRRFSE